MYKICMLVGYYPINRGGAEYQSYLLARALKKTHNFFFISIDHDENRVFYEDGFKIYTLKAPNIIRVKKFYFLLWKKIYKILNYEKPKIIYQRLCYSATGIAARYSLNNKCKMIWHISSNNDVVPFKFKLNARYLINIIEKRIAEYGIKNAHSIICQTKFQNKLLYRNYKRNCELYLPNFHEYPKEIIEKIDPIKVLWIANIKPVKQPNKFAALAKSLQNVDNVKFIMIGKEGSKAVQNELASKIKNLNNLSYQGEIAQDTVNKILAESHILVNTSIFEGLPNTFIQAWMRKVPVLSLNVDPDKMLEKYGVGICSKTMKQLVIDTKKLIINNELREEIGNRAQELAFKKFSMKNIEKFNEFIKAFL